VRQGRGRPPGLDWKRTSVADSVPQVNHYAFYSTSTPIASLT
jgi:hypothetical protein